MKNIAGILISFILVANCFGQTRVRIDSQSLQDNRIVELCYGGTDTVMGELFFEPIHYLEFIDYKNKDSVIVPIKGILMPGSLFFLNDSLGFITEHKSMPYACFLNIYRTENGGKTWTLSASRWCDGGTSLPLSDIFFMFDELNGIIVWRLTAKGLLISKTQDGGKTWLEQNIPMDISEHITNVSGVYFSISGQVTVILDEPSYSPKRKPVEILQSNDFGLTFNRMK